MLSVAIQPITGHWGLPDPVKVVGTDADDGGLVPFKLIKGTWEDIKSPEAVAVDHLLEPPALDERPVDVVEPGALAQTVELGEPALELGNRAVAIEKAHELAQAHVGVGLERDAFLERRREVRRLFDALSPRTETIRDLAEGRSLGDTTTLADAGVVETIRTNSGSAEE